MKPVIDPDNPFALKADPGRLIPPAMSLEELDGDTDIDDQEFLNDL